MDSNLNTNKGDYYEFINKYDTTSSLLVGGEEQRFSKSIKL